MAMVRVGGDIPIHLQLDKQGNTVLDLQCYIMEIVVVDFGEHN